MILQEEEVKEAIKLIDDFMEYPNGELPKVEGSIPWGNYSNSWEWMMPVFFKINSLGKEYNAAIFKTYISVSVEIGGKVFKDFSFAHAEYITATQDGLEAMFKIIVKFIKWYNEKILNK